MAESGKHRRPRTGSTARVVARGGLVGVVAIGCGLAVRTMATSAGSTSVEVLQVPGTAVPTPVATREPVRPILPPSPGPRANPAVKPTAPQLVAPASQPVPSTLPAAVAPTAVPTPAPVIDLTAVARAKRYVGTVGDWRHLCLGFVRTTFGLPEVESSAIQAWRAAQYKHRGDANPPAGVPVFWSGGSSGAGHVAVSLGDGWIVSTDFPYAGHIAKGRLSDIADDWGLDYLGWTEDLEGVRIYTP